MEPLQQRESEGDRFILFVDDEPGILTSLTRLTREWAEDHGITIRTAPSGTDALELLEALGNQVWVMISDLKMPGMSGADLVLQTRQRYPDLVTIVLTGYANLSELNKTIRAGIFAYLSKPWENDELLHEIERAYQHARIQRENTRYIGMLEAELRWAGELQQKLLEVELPQTPEVTVAVRYNPLPWLSCGGDYYDVIPFGKDALIVLIGDVAGHGVKGAFITAILKSMIYRGYIRNSLTEGFSPAAFLDWLNLRILEQFSSVPDLVLTFSASLVDLSTRTIITAGAGHEPVFVNRAGNDTFLAAPGPVLGVSADATFENRELPLQPGDVLTFITDGVNENSQKHEKLPPERLLPLLAAHPDLKADTDALLAACRTELAMPEQIDDITIIRMQIH